MSSLSTGGRKLELQRAPENGALVRTRRAQSNTPHAEAGSVALHAASRGGEHAEAVIPLVADGADVNKQNKNGGPR